MNALDLARWQFAIVTVYHFLFVPLTLGMSVLVAGLQTAWYRTGNPMWLRATRFWGKLFLINFAMGVVTGIVQEFQFGMNWSDYSRFVGDIFGAPLAVEALLAFFLESTFLGLWIFGWDKLPKKLHLATIWAAAAGTWLSAYMILAANSWMQHPVGYVLDPVTGRAVMNDFFAVVTNSTNLVTFPHVLAGAMLTAGALFMAISAWHVRRGSSTEVFLPSLRLGAITTFVAGLAVAITGDMQGKLMYIQQPMKMASAEALYTTETHASFSIFTIGSLDGSKELFSIKIPGLLSFLAGTDTVPGINQLQEQYQTTYGAGNYVPNIPSTYWSFRLMIGFGLVAMAIAIVALFLAHRRSLPKIPGVWTALTAVSMAGLLGNSFGWIFTEMGRQPWSVFGVLTTGRSVSPSVSAFEVAITLVGFTLLYAVLAFIEVKLLVRYAKAGPISAEEAEKVEQSYPDSLGGSSSDSERPLTFAY